MDKIAPEQICPHRLKLLRGSTSIKLPCCLSHPLDEINTGIHRVVIVIHGVLRNADVYFENMSLAAEKAGTRGNTLIIAPQFLVEEDIITFNLHDDIPYWGGETGEGWKKGDDSLTTNLNQRLTTISSFDVVDQIISTVANQDIFPNLNKVVITGHSAGGQFVNRYAAGTRIDESLPEKIHLRFIVANPSTYMYLNGERRVLKTTDKFEIPLNAPDNYDHYKYGLMNLNPYMDDIGAEKIREQYPDKDVVYLLGGEDTKKHHLELSTNAMLQGLTRLERGQIYFHYLCHLFGERIKRNHQIHIIPCVGHDNAAMFMAPAGINAIFDV